MFEEIYFSRRRFLGSAAMTIAATHFGTIAWAKTRSELYPLARATAWLNSPPLTEAELQGKVVLVEFWTYTCINWRRQLPYVRAWAEKYKDQRLVVIGVHAPEFSFEKETENVRWAVKDMRIAYPVAIDNDHAIWRGLNNHYWPSLYFADAQGKIRHHVFGEGQYEQSEIVIQKLLVKNGVRGIGKELVSVDARGAEAAADWSEPSSRAEVLAMSSTADLNTASFTFEGVLKPLIFLTNCSAAARISASVTGGSKLNSVLMFLHIASPLSGTAKTRIST